MFGVDEPGCNHVGEEKEEGCGDQSDHRGSNIGAFCNALYTTVVFGTPVEAERRRKGICNAVKEGPAKVAGIHEYRINGNEASLTPSLLSGTSELKSRRISSDELERAADSLTDRPTLRGKLRDLALVGETYKNLVKQSFDDASDDLYKLCDKGDADEVIISSCGSFCLQASEIDGKPVGGKQPEMLKKLQDALMAEYLEYTDIKD